MDDGRGMTTAGTASDRKHILIVDDDPNELKMLRYYLKDHYKVTVISSGRTAMEFMSKYTPDLVLLDYLMPENNKSSDMTMKKAYKTNRAGCIFMHLPAPVIFDNAFPLPCHGLSFGCAESPPGG